LVLEAQPRGCGPSGAGFIRDGLQMSTPTHPSTHPISIVEPSTKSKNSHNEKKSKKYWNHAISSNNNAQKKKIANTVC
jgi:hypothetical protein